MNKYEKLTKLIILKILDSLNIIEINNAFNYKLTILYPTFSKTKTLFICKDDDKIFNLLGLNKKDLVNCKDELSTYNYLSKSRFYGKDFMNLIEVIRDHRDFKTEGRLLWRTCYTKGYSIKPKLEDEILYIKMIDRFCNSNIEKAVLEEAAIKIRNKNEGVYASINNILTWGDYKTEEEANSIRKEFYKHISSFYVGHEFPVEQYLSETNYLNTKKDFLSFIAKKETKMLILST